MNKIKTALENIFKDHRIVFWYYTGAVLNFEFNDLEIEGVEKIAVNNDEFGIKYKILREEPDKKFLLYFQTERPEDSENWLLDLNLCGYEFFTDQSSLYLQELELPLEFKDLLTEHIEFFKNSKRIQKLKEHLIADDTERKIKQKMIGVICETDNKLSSVLLSLFTDLANDNEEKYSLLNKLNLRKFFWEETERVFHYSSDNPSILDLAIEIFKANYHYYLNKKFSLSHDAIVFVSSWMDSNRYRDAYNKLSEKIESILKISDELVTVDYKTLIKANVFKSVDQKIISELKSDIISDTIKYEEAKEIIQYRKDRGWYGHLEHTYNTIEYAVEFIAMIKKLNFSFNNLAEGFDKYTKDYFRIDHYYRKTLYEFYNSGNSPVLSELIELIEKQYSNNFLLTLNDRWQNILDKNGIWEIKDAHYQREFFSDFVKPHLDKNQRIFVIISDALRYEIGVELLNSILEEKRFHASITPMYCVLPSFTSAGMAALLPHKTLSFKENTADVLCDDMSSSGTLPRTKILQQYKQDSVAIRSNEFLNKNTKSEGREFVKEHSLIYIYSDTIDAVGDDKDSEQKVISAIQDEINNIIRILKHIVNCNGNNVLITADHGFIYQNQKLEESDYTEYERRGEIFKDNRRFIVGKGLFEQNNVKKYISSDIGFDGSAEILITKSINRLRIKGSGSRFVHGGASLQEITIPVIEFNKKRTGEIEYVEVDVIRNFNRITANQVTVSFFQVDVVEEKIQPRILRIGFYAGDGHLLSDQPSFNFNSTENEALKREKKHRFTFTKDISKYNNQTVYMKLEYQIPNTNQFIEYKSIPYSLQISFTSDFDDF